MKIELLELFELLDSVVTSEFPREILVETPLFYNLDLYKDIRSKFEAASFEDQKIIATWACDHNINLLAFVVHMIDVKFAVALHRDPALAKLFKSINEMQESKTVCSCLDLYYGALYKISSGRHLEKTKVGTYRVDCIFIADYINLILEKNNLAQVDYGTYQKANR